MTQLDCENPVGLATLLSYWLGELDDAREAQIEQHFLGCAACSDELAELAALAEGIRSCLREGSLRAVVTPLFAERLAASGLHVREYRVARNGSVDCTVAPHDDVTIARLDVPLADVRRLDVLLSDLGGEGGEQRIEDVPFDATTDEVVVIPRTDRLRRLPATTSRIRAIAVDDSGERVLGEYTFNHTPWAGDLTLGQPWVSTTTRSMTLSTPKTAHASNCARRRCSSLGT